MNRRAFAGIAAVACGGALKEAIAQTVAIPIIDTHIHLFDTTRPQGVPYPAKDNAVLYRPALPERYRKIAVPLGVTGAIEIEASPLLEDNQWVLDVAVQDKIMVGTIGNLDPGTPDFRQNFDRLHKNPLFLGIRYGNLWGKDLGIALNKPEFIADMKVLADAGMVLDTANQNASLIAATVRLTDKVPTLRVVIDHLPQFIPPASVEADLKELGSRPQVYVKVSEVLRRVDGRVPTDLDFYRTRLDEIFATFGENRVLYGSDWPNGDLWAEYPQVLGLVREYFNGKGQAIASKYFWRNSVAAYRWKKRAPEQPAGYAG